MNFEALKNMMDRLTDWRIPGNAICVYRDGQEIFRYQSGFADLENRIPMTPEHGINIYSCSKIATVTAALQLYEQGYFLLDDPLYSFIPEFEEMYLADGSKAKNPITLRHLFTMTSGLTYDYHTEAFEKARKQTDGKMNTQAVIRCLAKDPLSFEPGEKWQYSLSHDVLAAVVEVISGKKFRDYVRENIFEPLDMTKSSYHNEGILDTMAQQYCYVSTEGQNLVELQAGGVPTAGGYIRNVGKSVDFVFGPEYDSGGAGITTTVLDYAKFAAALAGNGRGLTGERILAAGTVELLKTNQLNTNQQKQLNWPQLKGYGYGLGVRTLTEKALSGSVGNLGEFGWGGAAGASVYVDTEWNLAAFYAHHMLNPQEGYYQPRIRNVLYRCVTG